MSDFSQVVKYLDIVKSRKITSAEADEFDGKASPLSKYQHVLKTRPIKKLQVSFSLLAHTVPFSSVAFIGQLMFQYNFTFNGKLFITSVLNNSALIRGGCLTVKYRVGSTVYRYALCGSQEYIIRLMGPLTHTINVMNFPLYDGQVIEKNCVFEFWANFDSALAYDPIGVVGDLLIESSRLVNPATPDEIDRTYGSVAAIDRAAFAVALPAALPYAQATQVWLDNI